MSAKVIVGLDGCGIIFKMAMKNLGIDDNRRYHESGANSDLDFIYNESASQVLMMYEPDIRNFCTKLLNAPDVKFFAHLPQFSNPQFLYNFSVIFKEFALALVFQINRYLGTRSDVDYLLEAIAHDYIIVFQDIRRLNYK